MHFDVCRKTVFTAVLTRIEGNVIYNLLFALPSHVLILLSMLITKSFLLLQTLDYAKSQVIKFKILKSNHSVTKTDINVMIYSIGSRHRMYTYRCARV